VFAVVHGTGQDEFPGGDGLLLFSVCPIQRKQDREMALAATNAQIPSLIGLSPGMIHRTPSFFTGFPTVVGFDTAAPVGNALRSSRIRVRLCIFAFR